MEIHLLGIVWKTYKQEHMCHHQLLYPAYGLRHLCHPLIVFFGHPICIFCSCNEESDAGCLWSIKLSRPVLRLMLLKSFWFLFFLNLCFFHHVTPMNNLVLVKSSIKFFLARCNKSLWLKTASFTMQPCPWPLLFPAMAQPWFLTLAWIFLTK